jgi:hypothetical protein
MRPVPQVEAGAPVRAVRTVLRRMDRWTLEAFNPARQLRYPR